MRRAPLTKLACAVLALAIAGGCRGPNADKDDDDDDDTSFVEAGTDASAVESDASVLASSLVSATPTGSIGLASADLSAGGGLRPSDIGDGARAIYGPRACLQVSHEAASRTVTYVFERCLGPNGLRAVTGTVHATYTVDKDQLHLELTADGLTVNNATVDWAATADVTSAGATRTMLWKATLSGTTAGGRTFSRTSEQKVAWTLGEACFSLSGTSTGQVQKNGDTKEIRTDVENFRRCRRSCPDAGGRIVFTNVTKNKRVEVSFDGTDRASAVVPNGSTISIPLLCRG